MSDKRTIYRVDVTIEAHTTTRYLPTLADARAWADEIVGDYPEPESVEIKQVSLKLSRRALCSQLNSILSEYCVNEH